MPRKYVIDVSVVRFRSWVRVNSMGGVVGWLNPKAQTNPFIYNIKVTNINFDPLQPHQKSYITQYEELDFL